MTLGDVPAHTSNQCKFYSVFPLMATNFNSEIVIMLLCILRFPEHSAFHKCRFTFATRIRRISGKLLIFCGRLLVLPSSDNLRSYIIYALTFRCTCTSLSFIQILLRGLPCTHRTCPCWYWRCLKLVKVKVNVKHSRYRPGVAQRVQGS